MSRLMPHRLLSGVAVVALLLSLAPGVAHAAAPEASAPPGSAPLTVDPCAAPAGAGQYGDSTGTASVTVSAVTPDCRRTYVLTSSLVASRTFTEQPGEPVLRTGSALLDGLYAMALDDARLDSADSVTNSAYNGGAAMDCTNAGTGCYLTGELWTYIWTRDVSYAADLGLSAIDPERMRNTLLFKLSDRRDGSGDTQILQDTGTGGSYPNSTDRVSWALGASEILAWLPDDERAAFAATAYEALKNTIEQDRQAVFDSRTGLYTGESSFLDWREQTYPSWVKSDVVQIAESETLSTNGAHWAAIDAAARLAQASGKTTAAARYQQWADALATAIRDRFWLSDKGQFSAFLPTTLDQTAVDRYDALGTALAVVTGIATEEQAAEAVANYPQTPYGPSVIWPQQQGEGTYHNNGIWPFVTA